MANPNNQTKTGGGSYIQGNVQTEGGTFIGRDQVNHYLTQYLVNVSVIRTSEQIKGIKKDTLVPYLPNRPFREPYRELFTSRKAEIEQVVSQLEGGTQSYAIFGPADVGKTSLLMAGVKPRIKRDGTLVIHLRDYSHPMPFIRAAFVGFAQELKIKFPDNIQTIDLAEEIISHSKGSILILLDQFERFFLPGLEIIEREALQRDIQSGIEQFSGDKFQILVAIRDDFQAEFDRDWGDLLPDLRQSRLHLRPLLLDKAKRAIEYPLEYLDLRVIYTEDFVNDRLIDDLDNLYSQEKGWILPADLQIVCNSLYQAALGSKPPIIETDLYLNTSERKGAEKLLDLHLEQLLGYVPSHHKKTAEALIQKFLSQNTKAWVKTENILLEETQNEEVQSVLNALVNAGILNWHLENMDDSYAFATQSIANAAERLFGREAFKSHQAHKEIEYVWRAWISYDAMASKEQLAFIKTHYQRQSISPEKALLTLRSAVHRDVDSEFWLEQLKTERATRFIQQLEDNPSEQSDLSERLTQQDNARLLLGIYNDDLQEKPADDEFGQVTWSAVANPDSMSRETASLALLSGYGTKSLDRIKDGVSSGKLGRGRLAELRGMLADASDDVAKKVRENVKPFERMWVWWWRFKRHLRRDFSYIGTLSLGSAIGAGFGLALFRALMAIVVNDRAGVLFYNYFPLGFLFSGSLSLGLILEKTIRLQPIEKESTTTLNKTSGLKLSLGASFFALTHVLMNFLLEGKLYSTEWFTILMALAGGAILGVALHDQPKTKLRPRIWIIRLLMIGMVYSIIQLGYIWARDLGVSLIFVWDGSTYRLLMHDALIHLGLESILSINNWFHYFSIVDSFLSGIIIAVGFKVGSGIANNLYQKYQGRIQEGIS